MDDGDPGPDAPGLVRNRLTHLFGDGSDYRVGLIVAPAGSGKSTLAAQIASAHPGPVAWCDLADRTPRTEPALLAALARPLQEHLGPAVGDPADVDDLVAALGRAAAPLLIVLDDAHVLDGSDAERALAALVDRIPAPVRLLLASRVNLDVDLSRARVSGRLIEVGLDDLRFRTWEVEQLFGGVYRDRLGPEDVAVLTRRTAGWAAYLQLFHLATTRKTPVQRRQLLSSLNNPSRTVRDYLSRQVLAGLSEELRDFLIRTSVLRRPTAALCDELLGRTGSAVVLAELERRQVFTERVDVDDSYRYHAVMLAYLDSRLVETVGLTGARRQHRVAAELLEHHGYVEESVTAYAKAEDWPAVQRLLEHLGVAGDTSVGDTLLDLLPASTLDNDPWLLMTKARRSLGRGALRQAVAALSAAEASASGALADRCRAQRSQITAWLFSEPSADPSWTGQLRAATQRTPAAVAGRAADLDDVHGRFLEAASALLTGDVRRADRLARVVVSHPDAGALLVAASQIISLMSGFVMCAETPATDVGLLQDSIEAADTPWLDRQVRALMALSTGGRDELEAARRSCQADGDRWGEALIVAYGAAADMVTGLGPGATASALTAAAGFEDAAASFGQLGAGVLEAWCWAYASICWWQSDDGDRAVAAAQQTRTLAALRDVPGASGVAALVLGTATGDGRQLTWAEQVLEPFGLWTGPQLLLLRPLAGAVSGPPPTGSVEAPAEDPGSPGAAVEDAVAAGGTVVRCLGGFSLVVGGKVIDEASAKPMERAALHVLAMRVGEGVHREELGEMLWPGAEPDAARHRLQVAISALRRLVGPEFVVRRGDAYRLDVPADADVDLWRLRDSARAATSARAADDEAAELAALEQVLGAYRGPLLPGDGPVDWVIGPRGAAQSSAAGAALRLATLRLDAGDLEGAAGAARIGLEVDRFRDDLWNVAIAVAEQAEHHAEAAQLRLAYEAMLDEIGVVREGT